MVHRIIDYKDPFRVYKNIKKENSIFLDSQKNGRYSYIALNPEMIFRSKGERIEISDSHNKTILFGNPIHELKRLLNSKKIVRKKDWPLFYSGAIGYFGYNIVQFFEDIPLSNNDDLEIPDIVMIFPRDVICFDQQEMITHVFSSSNETLSDLMQSLAQEKQSDQHTIPSSHINFESNFTREEYYNAVNKCIGYVKAGESYQIKISQRFSGLVTEDPLSIYERLRKINPSPYGAFLDLEECTMASCSPELLVKTEENRVETKPIGGTYPKSQRFSENRKLINDFLMDGKERAEHNMLIDLERNDLGKICERGSIKVTKLMDIEEYSHLIHYVTTIEGKISEDKDSFDVLRAMFPGGTITGCPKIRTMKIIDEVEPTSRGPFTGSIGFINYSDEMNLNLVIRTIIFKENVGYFQSGGGIVSESDPQREYEETLDKVKAIFEALSTSNEYELQNEQANLVS